MIDLEENKRTLTDMEERLSSLEKTIGTVDELEKKLKELEHQTLAEGFWNDNKKSNSVLQEIKSVKAKYTGIKDIKQNIANLLEMNEFLQLENDEELSKELEKSTLKLEKDLEKLETKMLLSGKYDKNNAIITLHAGAGGTEAVPGRPVLPAQCGDPPHTASAGTAGRYSSTRLPFLGPLQ